MGYAKLNIWVRDQNCKPFYIMDPDPYLDYVEIYNCLGDLIQHVNLQQGIAHAEVEVPPGCYTVRGHVCEHNVPQQRDINQHADWTMAIVGCNQEVCVNLIVHTLAYCIHINLPIFIAAARRARVSEQNIQILAQTMMAAGNIQPQMMADELERTITEMKQKKGSPERVKEYEETLKIFKGMKQAK